MTANQKAGLKTAAVCLLLCAGIASFLLHDTFQQRRLRFRLEDPNPAVRVATLRAMGREGHVDMLMDAFQDENADVRLVAAMCLQERRANAAPSAKLLLRASVEDNDKGVRREAAEALHAIGTAAAPTLVEALGDLNPCIRAKAAGALRVVAFLKDGQRASAEQLASVSAALERMRQDEDAQVREKAADSLTYIRRAEAGEQLHEGK